MTTQANAPAKHTPGRWDVQKRPGREPRIVKLHSNRVVQYIAQCQTIGNAERIVADHNACIGLNPEAVKDMLKMIRNARSDAQQVIDNWETGDLAGAVNGLEATVNALDTALARAEEA